MRFPVTVNGCVYPHGDKDVETRIELLERFTEGNTLEQKDVEFVTKFIEALAETIGSRRKSVFPGLGTFEWKPSRHRTPDGKMPENAYRLSFTLTRSKRRYKGETKHGNR